jgi:hypothetical protein
MKVTLSPTADAMLSRYPHSRERLLAALEGSPGHCFIDGKVGRIPGNDELVFRSPDYPALTIPHAEFADPAMLARVIQEWSSAGTG